MMWNLRPTLFHFCYIKRMWSIFLSEIFICYRLSSSMCSVLYRIALWIFKVSHFSWEILTNVLYYKYAIHSSGRRKCCRPTASIWHLLFTPLLSDKLVSTASLELFPISDNMNLVSTCLPGMSFFVFVTLLSSQMLSVDKKHLTEQHAKIKPFVQRKYNRVPRAEKGKGDNSNMNNW